jgi:hypothetical protein
MPATVKVTHKAIGAEVRCTGKRFLPIFLASFAVPRLALKLVRD